MGNEHVFGFQPVEESIDEDDIYVVNHTYVCLTLRSVVIVVSLIVGFGVLLGRVI